MNDPTQVLFNKSEFNNFIKDELTLKYVYNLYQVIHELKAWDKINKENKWDFLISISSNPILENGHSMNSISFCFNHMLYIKENGWESYKNKIKSFTVETQYENTTPSV